ncbi:hypothetical protein L1987_20009 [Smallanthus sonchifolius]|uniref:Uncharacterized protein n=1 Tax=Smallanthus sonchifolius TaxID=185202 RepID=A0ACB9IQL9_9ASTR|nr:hypothetical protein L1987_20009 [Smallanthus sonchifolius]
MIFRQIERSESGDEGYGEVVFYVHMYWKCEEVKVGIKVTVVARPAPHVRLPTGAARRSELTVGSFATSDEQDYPCEEIEGYGRRREGDLCVSSGDALDVPIFDLEKEVEETIRVGECVGIGMEGFENHVRNLIQGEMVSGRICWVGGRVKAFARRLVLLKLGLKKWRFNLKEAEGKLAADMGKAVERLECVAESRKLSVDEAQSRALLRCRPPV